MHLKDDSLDREGRLYLVVRVCLETLVDEPFSGFVGVDAAEL